MLPLQIPCNTSHALLSERPDMTYCIYEMCHTLSCATQFPVQFLTRVAAVPSDLAQRANFEVLQLAHNLAPCVVVAIVDSLHRLSTKLVGLSSGCQDVRGDVMPLYDLSRCGDPGGLPYVPNLAGVGLVSVHASVEYPLELPLSAALRLHRIAICLPRVTPRPRA